MHCHHITKRETAELRVWLGWVRQGLTSHSTHFRSFRRRWGDWGISQDCSHSQGVG